MNNNAETRQSFIQLVMCRLGFHKWTYDKDTVVKCNKTCKCCGKIQDIGYLDPQNVLVSISANNIYSFLNKLSLKE